MRFTGWALGVGVVCVAVVACGGNSESQPAAQPSSAGASTNQSGSASAGASGKQSQGGGASGGVGGTAGTGGRPPQSGCPMDLGSWTVETCVPIPTVPVQQPSAGGAGSGGESAGGAPGEGGEGGASAPVCPPMPTFSPAYNPPPQLKGNLCCYYQTMICG